MEVHSSAASVREGTHLDDAQAAYTDALMYGAQDHGGSGENGGALDALWRCEAAYHFLLNNELGPVHMAFVDDLYDAMDHARVSLEQQSARVLAVLHDKDVRIQELEDELMKATTSVERVDEGVQVTIQKPKSSMMDQAVQCDVEGTGNEIESLHRRVEEQNEQIEVLLDELERIQRVLADKETAKDQNQVESKDLRPMQARGDVRGVSTASQSAQTEEEKDEKSGFNPTEALAAIAALEMQVEMVEKRNTELNGVERQRRTIAQREDTRTSLDGVEGQLSDAIRKIESCMASQCTVSTLLLPNEVDGKNMSCVDLEHRLQLALVEREQLIDQVLALRAEFCSPDRVTVVSSSQRPGFQERSECNQLTCLHTLRRILQLVQSDKIEPTAVAVTAKTLKNELRRALRDRGNDADITAVVAQVTRQWMEWEKSHVKEIEAMRRRHRDDLDVIGCRIAHLVDEVHRMSQLNIDLQTELKAANLEHHTENTQEVTTVSIIDSHHRTLVLEQSLQVAREQLGIAHRAIQALSAGGDGSFVRAVRFANSESSSSEQLSITRALNASDCRQQIKQLSEELIAAKGQQFKRLLPLNASEHAVVEYFRLEREALHLRNRLKEKDQQIHQLEIHREQLEKSYNSLHAGIESRELLHALQQHSVEQSSAVHSGQRVFERLYLRHLRSQNSELRAELMKARSRVVCLERELGMCQEKKEEDVRDSFSILQSLISKMEVHHGQSLKAFQLWQTSVRQHYQELTLNESTISNAYAILLVHYEALSTQLRLLQESTASEWTAKRAKQGDDFADLPTHWRLVDKINVLQDRLLQIQVCQSCGKHVQPPIQRVDEATSTMSLTTSEASIQTSARERRRAPHSLSVQVRLGSLQTEESPPRIDALIGTSGQDSKSPTAPSSHDAMAGSSVLQGIQQQLEASLARIAELTAREEKLKERLDQAQMVNKKHAKDREKLLSQVNEVSSSNSSLTSKVLEYERMMKDQRDNVMVGRDGAAATDDEDPSDVLNRVRQQLSLREQENVELVRQLCQAKEKCCSLEKIRNNSEHKIAQLTAALEAHQLTRDQEKNTQLEVYMSKVNQSLETIERDKQRLANENQQLNERLSEIAVERAKKDGQGTRSCGTETENDAAADLQRLLALPEHQELQTRVVLLSSEFANERRGCETIRGTLEAEKLEASRRIEAQLESIKCKKADLARLVEDLKISHESLQQEFIDYQAVNTEAKAEADKRIEFLTKCVEECSRLVDSAGPGDEIVTARDIYDTIIAVSKRVVAGDPCNGGSNSAKKKAVKNVPVANHSQSHTGPSALRDEQASAAVFHSQLQAETWRVRIAKLEASLRAATLKNTTFEDMVDHLEVQMDSLREEVKDRMSKESALLTKQGQMKVEVANLKAQTATLTCRLAEACGELKRTQDASKANDGEITRLRSALQRKTELLTRLKTKADETQQALDNSVKRIAQLENTEKTLASTQLKSKDQTQQLQELRQQCLVYRDTNAELSGQVQKYKDQLSESHSRVKGLRLDNGLLRDQLRELKNAAKKEAKHAADGVVVGVSADGKLTNESLSATAAIEVLTSQVKTLKRRVLQKQEVVVAHKTKISELDAELVLLRSKLFEISQSYRHQHQFQQQKEQSMMQGVTHLKEELEASVLRKAEQLDGLRASIFDAFEVFVHCEPPSEARQRRPRSPASSTSSASLTLPEDEDDEGLGARGRIANELLLELRRYADLSPTDLADLHISDSRATPNKKTRSSTRQRQQDLYAHQRTQKQGQQLLADLEHALEVTPQDCRTEICQVLEFVSSKRIESRAGRRC